MDSSIPQPQGSGLRHRVDAVESRDLHKVEKLRFIPLDMAKAHVGKAVRRTLQVTGKPLKDFGDKSQVGRWCRGEENPNVARICQDPEARRQFALALLLADEDVEIRTVVTLPAQKVG